MIAIEWKASLLPIARHSMWEEVGRMVRIPFSSTVLQRRRGYRRVLQHFSRIRLAPMIPLDKDGMRDLLELKNIALLYELWTFFRLVHEISAVLGSPPVRSGRLASDLFQTAFAAGGTFEWDPGVRLVYNQPLLQVGEGTKALLLRAADSRHRSPGPRRAERRPSPVRREVPGPRAHRRGTRRGRQGRRRREGRESGRVRSSVQTSTRCTPTATRFRTPDRCGSCTRAGSFGSLGCRAVVVRLGDRVGSSPEGLPGEFEGVGAIPVGPVVGRGGGPWPGNGGCE